MRIGLFLYRINPDYAGGVNSYVMSLLEGFKSIDRKNTYILFVNKRNRHLFQKFEGDNFIIKEIKLEPFLKRKLTRFFVDYFGICPGVRTFFPYIFKLAYGQLISLVSHSPIDVLYCPYEFPAYWQKPTVVSIHDIQHAHFPKFFNLGQRWHRNIFYKETVRGATIVQASSEYIKQDFINYFKISLPEKVIVVRDGINEIFKRTITKEELLKIKNKYDLPQNFIFYPAQHWRHKNHLNLIKAVSLLKRKKNLRAPLVFTGEINQRFDFLYKAIRSSGLEKDVKLLGNVPFGELPVLYKLATLMVMPSLHESNSLPVMEALSVGCAVAASNIEPNMELNVDNAITIFDPNDPEDMAEKIRSLWENAALREGKIKLGQRSAQGFSWEKTAHDYISIFEKTKV